MGDIKVGYLISYDYEFVKTSLPIVYNFVDEIILAVDVHHKTWAGEEIHIKDEFWIWVDEIDKDKKIKIYKDSFYVPELSPMECDTRERTLLSQHMGNCDWYLQIDADEYFVDFKGFINKLRAFNPQQPTSVYCRVKTLFKKVSTGYLLIDDSSETLSFATNHPAYDVARTNNSGNHHVYWEDLVLHQSWARTPEEIYLKLNNWSHKDDFNIKSFYNLWNAIDEFNYHAVTNFHPLTPAVWPKLAYIKGNTVELLASSQIRTINADVQPKRRKSLLSRLWKEIKSTI